MIYIEIRFVDLLVFFLRNHGVSRGIWVSPEDLYWCFSLCEKESAFVSCTPCFFRGPPRLFSWVLVRFVSGGSRLVVPAVRAVRASGLVFFLLEVVMVARSLVVGVSGVVHFVSFVDGVVVADVCLPDHRMVSVRHRVGARGGISLDASRALWKYLVSLKRVGLPVQFFGRPGWDNWFDAVDVDFSSLRDENFLEDETAATLGFGA